MASTFVHLDTDKIKHVLTIASYSASTVSNLRIKSEEGVREILPFPDAAIHKTTGFTAMNADVDNRNGLTPNSEVTLRYEHSKTTTFQQTLTESFSTTAGFEITASFKVFGIGGEATTSFEFNYTTESSKTYGQETTDTVTFEQKVPVTVPTGKVYRVILTAESQTVDVPFQVHVRTSGLATGYYDGPGTFDFGIGQGFGYVRQHNLLGNESQNYDGSGESGIVIQRGTLNGAMVGRFRARTEDVTDEFMGVKNPVPKVIAEYSFDDDDKSKDKR